MLHEKARRCWAACEALSLGRGGISLVASATELSRPTIRRGIAETPGRRPRPGRSRPCGSPRIRRPGGGRHPLAATDRTLLRDLKRLIDPATRGDPMSPLLWTCKSTRNLADALVELGHDLSHQTVGRLLDRSGLQPPGQPQDRGGRRTTPIATPSSSTSTRRVRSFQRRGQPVVSVDTKKKEIVGNYKNPGREWEPEGRPRRVKSKDFPDKELGKVAPYGVYDLTADEGWVSVGIDHDTAEFAVESMRRWWYRMGRPVYPEAKELLITADCGREQRAAAIGCGRSACKVWRMRRACEIAVCHFPPGTSKWNKIEHRMFCHITENWRGRPLVSRAVVVNLIGSTRTRTGLRIQRSWIPTPMRRGSR